MNKPTTKKGFTLIELLIVIGILAILATVTLLVLNPAQMFAQARDSQRISDLNTIKSAIALYLSTYSTPYLDNASGADCTSNYLWGTLGTTTPFQSHTTFKGATATTSVTGTGWIPVGLNNTSGGSPISSLPLDPSGTITNSSNTTVTQSYAYACSTTGMVFEINASMESTRYANGGTDDKESNDGGDRSWLYEVGTALNL